MALAFPGGLGTQWAMRSISLVAHPFLTSLTRDIEYLANARGPTLWPSPSELMKLRYAGWSATGFDGSDLFHAGMLSNGIDMRQSPSRIPKWDDRRTAWVALQELMRPRWPIETLRRWWWRSRLVDANLANVTRDRIFEGLSKEGLGESFDRGMFLADREDIGLSQALELRRIGVIESDDALKAYLAALGYVDADIAKLLTQLQPMPSASAILAATASQAWDARFARRWGLSDGQSDQYRLWARRAGLTLPAGLGNYGQSLTTQYPDPSSREGSFTEVDPTWGDLLWRTHWRLPSLGQLAEWVHRFRGDPAIGSSWSVPTVKPLSDDELAQLMAANGVPAEMHEQTYNLMFRPLTLRDVRMLVRGGESDAVKVTGWLLDNGYSPDNAGLMARRIIAEETNKGARLDAAEYAAAIKRAIKDTIEAYSIGLLSQADTLEKLQDAGLAELTAQAMVGAADLSAKNKLAQSVMRRARQDLFAGRTNPAGALSRLISAGVQSDKAGDTVRGWTLEYGEGRRYLATDRTLRYLRKGFITKEVALQRLQNMGWANGDILLLLAEVQSDINADTAKAIHATETRQLKEEQAIQKQLESAARNANRLIARLKELTPPKTLIQWYVDGVWSEAKVRQRFSLMGYPSDIVDSMLLDALEKKKPKAKPASGAKK